jgi:hypothetical protein
LPRGCHRVHNHLALRSPTARDFFTIADDLITHQTPFPGMFFIQPRATIGEAVRIIAEAAKVLDAPAMENRIAWVP